MGCVLFFVSKTDLKTLWKCVFRIGMEREKIELAISERRKFGMVGCCSVDLVS